MYAFKATTVLSAALALVTLAGAGDAPSYQLTPTKPGDVLIVNKEGTTLTIHSKSGIGGVRVKLAKGQWPKTLTIRFQHGNDVPFKGLESFKLATEKSRVEGSANDSGKMPFFLANADGKFERKGEADVTVKTTKQSIEVTVPATVLRGAKTAELSWIDFFRN